jgi:hypothetical protein
VSCWRPVSRRTLVFVQTASDAPPAARGVDIVVLDSAWTPLPGDRSDLLPIRPTLQSVVTGVDLFDGIERLDAWAAAVGLADRLVMDGVSWWFRLRMVVHWDLHERRLWRHALDALMQGADYATVVVPVERRALVDAARATRDGVAPVVVIEAAAPLPPPPGPVAILLATLRPMPRRAARAVRRVVRRLFRHSATASQKQRAVERRALEVAGRVATLGTRIEAIASRPGSVLAIASANFFQVLREGDRERFVDPHLALVLDRLETEGTPVVTLALALDHRRDPDWVRISADDRLLPDSILRGRYVVEGDLAIDMRDVLDRLVAAPSVPLDVGGWDLGPAMLAIVVDQAQAFLDGQRRWTLWAERLMRELRPGLILVDHEGVRTLWLAAAKRVGIPVVAVQHGLIYPNNAEYTSKVHPGLVRPDLTCVYGTYERGVLIEGGGYASEQVIVTGSSRADPDAAITPATPTERADVRRELGVRDGDRMIVVSVAHNPIMGDVHSVCMVERLLGGPLPGVHIVFKLHPQEKGAGPYERLLRGKAAAAGYDAPAMTSVRDFDLYRLLRSADAHVGQYSTVNTDAIVAGTPTLLAVGQAHSDMLGYVAAGVAIPVRDVDELRRALEAGPTLDPDARARFLAAHFERGDATGRIVAAMRSMAAR